MFKLQKSILAIASIALLNTTSAYAETTANIGASSNYLFRGVTQTNNATAVSGGIDYTDKSGIYAGTWISNVDFGDATSYEADFYFGFAGQSGVLNYDVGYIYYAYPDADSSINFGELYGELTWKWLSTKISYMSNSQSDFTTQDDMLYLELNASFNVLNNTELALHFGQTSGDTATELFGEDYIDYGISLSKDGFTLGLSNTDLEEDDIKAYVGYAIEFDL